MIELNAISKTFGTDAVALNQVSFTVAENEFFTLLGPSGCGKTTLLRIIAGFEFCDGGGVRLDGDDLSPLPPEKRPVNTVFQNYALFPHMSVLRNVAFGMEMRGAERAEAAAAAQRMLRSVMLDEFADRFPAQLSGGQQQRVALARALINQPRVLLLDEPLSALDFKLRKTMRIELKRLQRETGITFIFVTHDQEEALAMSDRIAVMRAGEVRQIGAPMDIYEKPADRFVADFIGETNFLTGRVESTDGDGLRVTLRDGTALSAQSHAAGASGAVTLAIRPERVTLSAAADQTNVVGKVGEVVYQGNTTRYQVALRSGDTIAALTTNAAADTARLKAGDDVGVRFEPRSLWVLRE
ncbi:MAG: ABC transporter ATP-binding protein [bacterium]